MLDCSSCRFLLQARQGASAAIE
ncbi:hypothetical protein ACBQ04_05365 [Psychrobacter faecalis]